MKNLRLYYKKHGKVVFFIPLLIMIKCLTASMLMTSHVSVLRVFVAFIGVSIFVGFNVRAYNRVAYWKKYN